MAGFVKYKVALDPLLQHAALLEKPAIVLHYFTPMRTYSAALSCRNLLAASEYNRL